MPVILAVLIALFFLHVPKAAAALSTEKRGPMLAQIRASLATVGRDEALPWILSGYGALLFFGPSTSLILPLFALQILHLNPFQVGLLFSAAGLGTIIGALSIATLGDFRYKGWLLLISFLVWAFALLLFALSHVLWLSMLALLLFGLAQNGVGATTITLMQMRVPPQMRGRVMSLNTLFIMGVRPLGDFPAGALIGLNRWPFDRGHQCGDRRGLYALFIRGTPSDTRVVIGKSYCKSPPSCYYRFAAFD